MNVVPTIKTNKIAVKLFPAAEKKTKQRHPWIFESGIKKISANATVGDVVIIFDSKSNKFLAAGLFDPYSPIKIKLLQFATAANINSDWFKLRIQTALEIRRPLLETNTTSFRWIFGENDSLPGLIADVYNDVLVIKLYAAIWFPYLNDIVEHFLALYPIKTVVLRLSRKVQSLKNTFGVKDGQVVFGKLENPVVIFNEHGIRFSADVIKGHKTGYFLDHRENRRLVGEMAKDKKTLDVFSYAGGFSVHALANGAKSVTSVDISKQALNMAKENVALNKTQGKHITIAGDAFAVLNELIAKKETFDLVVIDPPSFAKSSKEVEVAKKQYAKLAKLGERLTIKGGTLVLASCSSRVSADLFFTICENTLNKSNREFYCFQKTFHDIDHPISFPEGAYLKTGYYRF